jgi:hypothetical protein
MVITEQVRASRGSGSLRERSPGVWEVRVVVGFDAVRRRSLQRSFTVRGDEEAGVADGTSSLPTTG